MQKYYVMAINQHLWNIALNLQSILGVSRLQWLLHASIR